VARNWELASKKATAPLCHLLHQKKKPPAQTEGHKEAFFLCGAGRRNA
jgi:hypothetical protein